MPSHADPIDWAVAARVGRSVSGVGPTTDAPLRARVRADFKAFSAQADELVRGFTGLSSPDAAPEPIVLDRGGWIDANMAGVKALVRPLADKLEEKAKSAGPMRRVTSAALGVQVGMLLGYMGQKVLGQFDLLMASDDAGKVYYVGPNIVQAERRFNFDTNDFRLWIALHEMTHRLQFAGVPWLRQRMSSLMEQSLGSLELDPERVKMIVKRGKDLLLGGPAAWRSVNVMELLMSDQQREVVGEIQALMTIVEGHGTFVMNRLGRELLPSFEHMEAALSGRRENTGGAERAFQRAIGMDLKYQQYKLGEQFMEQVAERAGVAAAHAVWRSEETMPSLEELSDAEGWLARVGL